MRINGKDYKLRLTVAAAIETEKLCPEQDITRIGELLHGTEAAAVGSVIGMVKILSEGYANREKHKGRAAAPVTDEELIGGFADELFFSHLVESITDAFERDYHGKIASKPTKKGREAARRSNAGKRTLEASLPWFLFFGARHGMDDEAVLNTPFGEFQDLMTCDAIYHGFAKEVTKKKKLTQEEMLALE